VRVREDEHERGNPHHATQSVAEISNMQTMHSRKETPMKPQLRVPLAIAVALGAISVGAAGVHASECVRFIRQHVRHHKVSAATAARWAAWSKAHPDWRPRPTPKETLAKLDFACQVPVIENHSAGVLQPLQLAPIAFPMEMVAPPEQPVFVASNPLPPPVLTDQPNDGLVSPPIYTPEYPALFGFYVPPGGNNNPPPPPQPTPEPGSVLLLATGLAGLGAVAWRRRRQVSLAAA
jgi:hypothetical protein